MNKEKKSHARHAEIDFKYKITLVCLTYSLVIHLFYTSILPSGAFHSLCERPLLTQWQMLKLKVEVPVSFFFSMWGPVVYSSQLFSVLQARCFFLTAHVCYLPVSYKHRDSRHFICSSISQSTGFWIVCGGFCIHTVYFFECYLNQKSCFLNLKTARHLVLCLFHGMLQP